MLPNADTPVDGVEPNADGAPKADVVVVPVVVEGLDCPNALGAPNAEDVACDPPPNALGAPNAEVGCVDDAPPKADGLPNAEVVFCDG